jgi:uncharacterized phiE125 gp8 family phage protein
MSLDTLANVKTALMITVADDDTLLTAFMDAAESVIENYCGRDFAGGSFAETHPAGGSLLFLRNYPVDTVTSLRVDSNRDFGAETERDADTYVVHTDRGVIESLDGPFLPPRCGKGSADWPGAVQVSYSTPTSDVPAAVKDAFARIVGHWYRQVKTSADAGQLMLTEMTTGGTDTKAYSWGLTSGLGLPPGALEELKLFRVPAV